VEALRAFLARKVVTRRTFDRLAASAKKKAFTVAGLARRDMLTTAHAELASAIEAGDDLRNFSKALSARFDSAGWTRLNPSHVETVFRNGVMGAYSDGRKAQMTQPTVLAARPYWQILGVDDARTRPAHRKAHGKVLPASDPFFTRAGPPFGHNCRDRVISRSAQDLKRLGLTPTIGAALQGLPDEGIATRDRRRRAQ
jgi:SPP1 gp7 family putative phage head morphogenesis protein